MDETGANESITLFADFDSANMARYERVYNKNGQNQFMTSSSNNFFNSTLEDRLVADSSSEQIKVTDVPNVDIEFNVWTKPDCEATPFVNGNRSWFYFGVKGGHGKLVRFNIMNLNRQAKLFEMGMLPVFRTVPGHEKWSRIYFRPTWQNSEMDFQMSFSFLIPDKKGTITYFAFCYPFSYEEYQTLLAKLDTEYEYCQNLTASNCGEDTIYYHRELLCKSLDKRRIDLITISACNNTNFVRESRFDKNLFPDMTAQRPYNFNNKRVYVLTSRVHPGETPASYVFNGFLDFILNKADMRARTLRKHFVFKLIPLLNPDGVYRGHYRTDQLGMNLNRVYLDPSFLRHPSIYAAKSLIIYHHIHNRIGRGSDGLTFANIFDAPTSIGSAQKHPVNTPECTNDEREPSTSAKLSSDTNDDQLAIDNQIYYELNGTVVSKSSQLFARDNHANRKDNNDKGMRISLPTNSAKSNKIVLSPLSNKKRSNSVIANSGTKSKMQMSKSRQQQSHDNDENNSDTEDNHGPIGKDKGKNSPHLNDPRLLLINPVHSGIAFYVDLHGHAAKRGCFIYGNSIENEAHQVDNVLYPKLISFNTQHFDFDGCNFTVKNMYYKDKREGLSKEGSGRVALYKTIGLIHSYTLECCYASGRVMNVIAPAVNANGRSISPPMSIDMPPKFLPEHYQSVGKGMAIAALDMYDLNPCTRIPNTTFGSLDSVRNWVRFYIRSKLNQNFSSTNAANKKTLGTAGRTWNKAKNGVSTAGDQTRKPFSFSTSTSTNSKQVTNTITAKQVKKPNPTEQCTLTTPTSMLKIPKNPLNKQNLDPRNFILKKTRQNQTNQNGDGTAGAINNRPVHKANQVDGEKAGHSVHVVSFLHENTGDLYDENICDSDEESDYGDVRCKASVVVQKDKTTAKTNDDPNGTWLDDNGLGLEKDAECTIKQLLYDNLSKHVTEMESESTVTTARRGDNDGQPARRPAADNPTFRYNNPFREIFEPKPNVLRLNLSAKTLKNETINNNSNNNNIQKVVEIISAVANNAAMIKPFTLKGITKSLSLNNHYNRKANIIRHNTIALNTNVASTIAQANVAMPTKLSNQTNANNLVKKIVSIRKISSNAHRNELAAKNATKASKFDSNSQNLAGGLQTKTKSKSVKQHEQQQIKNQLEQDLYAHKHDRIHLSQDSLPAKIHNETNLKKFVEIRNNRRELLKNDINQVC